MNKMIENLLFYKTFLRKAKPRLPKEYQEVEWIGRSDKGPYINTGVVQTKNFHFDAIMYGNKYICGGSGHNDFIYCGVYNSVIEYNYGDSGISLKNNDFNTIETQILNDNIEFTVDGVAAKTIPVGEIFETDTGTYLIFTSRSRIQEPKDSYAYIKSFKIKNDAAGTVIRNYVPCYRKSDGVIGMYDLCKSTCPLTDSPFYINAGTETFIRGADITSPYSYLTSTDTTRYPEVLNGTELIDLIGSEDLTLNTPDSSVWRSVIRKKDKVTGYLNEATGEFIPVYEGIPYAGDGRKMMMMRSPIGEENIGDGEEEFELYPEEDESSWIPEGDPELITDDEYEEEVNDDEGLMQTEEGDEHYSEHPDEAD